MRTLFAIGLALLSVSTLSVTAAAAERKKRVKTTKAKSRASRPAAPRGWSCPEGNASFKGDKPVLTTQASPVNTLAVCGKKLETGEFNGFDLFRVRGGITKSTLFTGGAMDRYLITASLDGVRMIELISIQDIWQPLIERQVECTDKKACRIVEKGCVFNYSRKGVEIPEVAKNAVDNSATDSIVTGTGVQGIADLALGGNKMAQLFFIEAKINEGIEAPAKVIFDSTTQLLRTLERKNCLP